MFNLFRWLLKSQRHKTRVVEYLPSNFALQIRSNQPRILLLKLDHIGDFFTAIRSFQAIRSAWPEADITLICSQQNRRLAEQSKYFNLVISFEMFPDQSKSAHLPEHIAASRFANLGLPDYDIAIDLRHDEDTRFLLDCVKARYICGFASERLTRRLDVSLPLMEFKPSSDLSRVNSPSAETRISLLARTVIDAFQHQPHPINSLESKSGIRHLPKRYIVICPTAGVKIKQWPLENFVTVVRIFLRRGFSVVLIGGRSSQEECRHIKKKIKKNRRRVIDMSNELLIEDLPKVLERASLFIGNDSGPGHMAAMLEIPTVVIFSGIANIDVWHPRGSHAIALKGIVPCSPCSLIAVNQCPNEMRCLTMIKPAHVVSTALKVYNARNKGRPKSRSKF